MIFLSLRVTADAEGGLKGPAQLRRSLQGFGGGQPPTSTRRVYTGALLAATCYRYVSMPQTSNGLYILNLLRSASMTPCRRSFPISADKPLRSTSR